MNAILHLLLSWQVILFACVVPVFIYLVKKINKHSNVLLGINALIQSPSGVFGLLTLAAITVVTWFQPTVGGTAFAAFVAVVPAILTFAEHRETLAGICQVATSPPPPLDQTTVTVTTADLPPRGQI
jgi:hypothetical protein